MKIVIVGLGYVGLSNAVLLAQHNEVIGVDISQERVDALNARISPIIDTELSQYLAEKDLNLSASIDLEGSVKGADYVIISTPTDYDEQTNFFDTSSVEMVISEVTRFVPKACIVVKSTIPAGFIEDIRQRLKIDTVIFSPEFLREGQALYDNLYPSRIIVGENSQRAKVFACLLAQGAVKPDIETLFTGPREAEAIKLFSNGYLAMRVAYFNELDSFALDNGLCPRQIIDGVTADPRIGRGYNNPSFGYGGYCLPKDTKQLRQNFDGTPQSIISAIIESNVMRKNFVTDTILRSKPNCVGVYKLSMKHGSDNSRESAIMDVIKRLMRKNVEIVVYDDTINIESVDGLKVLSDLSAFKKRADLILANRVDSELQDVIQKVFTRDIYNVD